MMFGTAIDMTLFFQRKRDRSCDSDQSVEFPIICYRRELRGFSS